MRLNNAELKSVAGGASIWAVVGVIAGIIFSFGAVDGYVRPIKCRK